MLVFGKTNVFWHFLVKRNIFLHFFGQRNTFFCSFFVKRTVVFCFFGKRNVSLCFFNKRSVSFPYFAKRSVFLAFFGKKKHLFGIFWCIGLLLRLLKPKVWDAGWVFWENFFGFIMRASRSTFLSAAIFDFVKFHFWWFLEGFCGNRTNFKGSVSATGWEFSKDSFTFVMTRLKLTFKSAPIFDFVKFHFWRFLRDLYGNPANFKGFASATG